MLSPKLSSKWIAWWLSAGRYSLQMSLFRRYDYAYFNLNIFQICHFNDDANKAYVSYWRLGHVSTPFRRELLISNIFLQRKKSIDVRLNLSSNITNAIMWHKKYKFVKYILNSRWFQKIMKISSIYNNFNIATTFYFTYLSNTYLKYLTVFNLELTPSEIDIFKLNISMTQWK